MSSFDINMIRHIYNDTQDMSLNEFVDYADLCGSINPDFVDHLRLYYLNRILFRKRLHRYFRTILLSKKAIVRRIGSSCSDFYMSDMYNSAPNKVFAKGALNSFGYECMYPTMYGYFELADIDSDIDKLIKQFEVIEADL